MQAPRRPINHHGVPQPHGSRALHWGRRWVKEEALAMSPRDAQIPRIVQQVVLEQEHVVGGVKNDIGLDDAT